jgi:hypothetical protein
MDGIEHPLDRREALADIKTLARVTLCSNDLNAERRDLEMIQTIVEMERPPTERLGPSLECVIMLTKSEEYRENARNCGEFAGEARDFPSKNRYRRMQDAWLALAEEQDWLDGQLSRHNLKHDD